MTSVKVNLAVVGGFVLAALVTLVLSLALLAGRTGPTDGYYTVYSNVSGLKFGSQVVFAGYPVGQVERVEPVVDDAGRVRFRIEMSVTRGWKIPDDSIATLESSGVLSPVIVAIAAGKSGRALEPGAMIPPGESGGWLSSLSSVAGNVDEAGTALLPLLHNIDRQVTLVGEVVEKDLRPLVANANQIVAETAQHWPGIMANAARASNQLDRLLAEDRVAALDRLIVNLDRAAQELQSLTQTGGADLKAGAQEFRFVLESLSRNAESFSQNLNSTSLNLQDFSRQIRQNPGLLLRAPEPQQDPVPPLRDERP